MNWCNKEPSHEKTFKVVYMGPVKTDKSSPVPSAGSYGHGRLGGCSGLEVIKLFSCSTQLSKKYQLLIESIILKNHNFFLLNTLRFCISCQ